MESSESSNNPRVRSSSDSSASRSVSSGGGGGGGDGDKSVYSASPQLWPEFVRKYKPNWTSKAERRMLYSDPGKLEYYDDGSLRIIDDEIKKAIKEQVANLKTAEERATASGAATMEGTLGEGGGGDEMIDGRAC